MEDMLFSEENMLSYEGDITNTPPQQPSQEAAAEA